MSITIDIHKSPMPIIWLDTSVLIDMVKIRTGKSIQDDQAKRLIHLYDLLYGAVRNNRAICPETEQRDELPRGRDAFRDTVLRLSLGIKSKSYYEIDQIQSQNHMESLYVASQVTHIS